MSDTKKQSRQSAQAPDQAGEPAAMLARAQQLMHTDTPYALAIVAEARASVEASGDISLLAELNRLFGVGHAVSGMYREAIEFFQTGFELQQRIGNFYGAAIMMTNTGNVYNFLGEHTSALGCYARSRELCERHSIEQHLPTLYLNAGYSHLGMNDYDRAIESLTTGFSLASRLGNKRVTAHILHNLGNIHIRRGDYSAAQHALSESLALNTELQNHHGMSAILVDLGGLHLQIGNYGQALRHLRKSLDICERLGDKRGAALALNNIGELYTHYGRHDSALRYLTASLRVKEELGNKADMAVTVMGIGKLYGVLGETAEALEYCNRCIGLAEEIGDNNILADVLCIAADQHTRLADKSTAAIFLRKAFRLFTELGHTAGCASALLALGLLYDSDTEQAIALLTNALQAAEATAAPPLLMNVHKALAHAYKQTGDSAQALHHFELFHSFERAIATEESERRRQHLLIAFDLEREQKNRAIAEREAGILRLENNRLEQEMEFRSKELVTTAIHLTQKNASLQKLRLALRTMSDRLAPELRDIARRMLHEIDSAVDAEHSWAHFEQQFRQVHQEYIEQIAARFPDITPTELKVCALIKLNLSTKEISVILNAEPRSIEKYRQRIRKKLGLTQSDNLVSFLHSLH